MKKTLFLLLILALFACSKQAIETEHLQSKSSERFVSVDWSVQDVQFTTGQTVEAKFSVSGFNDITSFQFAMKFDTAALAYSSASFTGAIPNFSIDNFGIYYMGYNVEPGEVRTVWYHFAPGGLSVPNGTQIFSLFFIAKKAGQLSTSFPFWPDNQMLPPEASDGEFNFVPLTVSYLQLAPISPPSGPKKGKKKKHGGH